jgi:hypothetical protein
MNPADFPVWWANVAAMLLFAGIAGAVFLVPRSAVMKDAPDQRFWRDIRWWAIPLVLVQLGIYLLFT